MDKTHVDHLRQAFRRVLALPITRSTYRELQNVVLTAMSGNQEDSQRFLEAFSSPPSEQPEAVKELTKEFAIPISVARDVYERAEFLALVTSDVLTQTYRVLLSNRIKRVDGQEFHVVTDIEATVQLLQHFFLRIQEIKKRKDGPELLSKYANKFKELAELANSLASRSQF
ncbi:MAG: DUF5414 family protein [Chlamydiia bacterium]|nr:DUF5414 family protein [Chlamydiia bacterium]